MLSLVRIISIKRTCGPVMAHVFETLGNFMQPAFLFFAVHARGPDRVNVGTMQEGLLVCS